MLPGLGDTKPPRRDQLTMTERVVERHFGFCEWLVHTKCLIEHVQR
jgi:hypothetical protein